jgi:hypothetical protein
MIQPFSGVLMPESQSREPFRSFTLRVPQDLYIELAEMARADGMHINPKANQLIRLGMGKHIQLDQALQRLLRDQVLNGEAEDVG